MVHKAMYSMNAENAMQIDIKTQGFSLTGALRRHAERRLRYALSSFDENIQRIVLRLSDINGPRGGLDKRCRLQLALVGLQDLVVVDTQSDLYVAIDRASDRARRTLARRVDRRKTSSNRKEHRLLLDSLELAYPQN